VIKTDLPETEMPPGLREKLAALVRAYKACMEKESRLHVRREMATKPLRSASAEIFHRYNARIERVHERRKAISAEFLELWAKQIPDAKQVVLPGSVITKRRDVRVEVHDKREVIKALDRLDRLDLVDHVIDEKGLRKLARDGALAVGDLIERAVDRAALLADDVCVAVSPER